MKNNNSKKVTSKKLLFLKHLAYSKPDTEMIFSSFMRDHTRNLKGKSTLDKIEIIKLKIEAIEARYNLERNNRHSIRKDYWFGFDEFWKGDLITPKTYCEQIGFISQDFVEGFADARCLKISKEDLSKLMMVKSNTSASGTVKLPKKDVGRTSRLDNQKQVGLLAYYLRDQTIIHGDTSSTLLADCFGKMSGYSTTQMQALFDSLRYAFEITKSENDFQNLINVLESLTKKIKKEKEEFKKDGNLQ